MRARNSRTHRSTLYLCGALAAVLALSACQERRSERVAFEGVFFKAKSSKVDRQREEFEVSVGPASASLDGAREAGRYEGTRYCLENFGSSEIEWSAGPDAEDGTLTIAKDRLLLRGRCTAF